jgi:hypothetical protein
MSGGSLTFVGGRISIKPLSKLMFCSRAIGITRIMATSSSTRVADYVFACLHGFKTLCDAPNIWESGLEKDVSQSDDTSQMSLLKLKDEQSRFMVWSGNIGAHRSGRSSLDYRLRDASNIRDHIIQILRNLIELLGDSKWQVSSYVTAN